MKHEKGEDFVVCHAALQVKVDLPFILREGWRPAGCCQAG